MDQTTQGPSRGQNLNQKPLIPGVKQIIAVGSGKGGVGKSTTAVNLALALAELPAPDEATGGQSRPLRVGILDADIYGPSIPVMLGGKELPVAATEDGSQMLPHQCHGIFCQSLGYLVAEDEAAVWRGPMASRALMQLLQETAWPELDVLVIDLPPGTGDIQLTLAQQVPLSGAVIVTTPQDLALSDAIRGIEMFRKVGVEVLGLVENMSLHLCSQCGHSEPIFGAGGGEQLAERYQVALLGQLPLDIRIRQQTDSGQPTVAAEPEGEPAQAYRRIAQQLQLALSRLPVAPTPISIVQLGDD